MLRKAFILSLAIMSGCSLKKYHSPTISELTPNRSTISDISLPKVTHKDVRDDYRELLKIVEDKNLREQIERRIASVYMLEGDHRLFIGESPPNDGYFPQAINSYNEVITKYPHHADNDESYYQLAKAYDIDGKEGKALETLDAFIQKYQESPRLPEVYFRKADIHFRQGRYKDAQEAYRAVIQIGQESPFLNNSYYLLGWTQYKLGDYDGGVESFSVVLDRLVPENGQTERLDKVAKSLVYDTLHILSLSLAYDGGAEKIRRFYANRTQSKKYQWLLYNGLGKHFLEKERYEDSAASYRVFVMQNPTSDRAPEMHSEMIRSYIEGDFSSQVLPEKESYVARYGIDSEFWRVKDSGVRAKVLPTLKSYLEELAKHYHGNGQNLKRHTDSGMESAENLSHQEKESFLRAAGYYQQYIKTFPEDQKIPEIVYMRSEALFDGGDYVSAIEGYEKTAYEYKSAKYGADAGYAAIIALQNHADELKKKYTEGAFQLTAWLEKTVESQLRFAKTYSSDKRASAVVAKTSEELFALKRYEKALQIANGIAEQKGNIDKKLLKTVYGVIAHCHYELGNYEEAEKGYRNQLKYIAKSDNEFDTITERMATVVYKQGEASLHNNDPEDAIKHFLRIKKIAPTSDARVIAQFDAATHMMNQSQWDRALVELLELREEFPQHKLNKDISQKIAYAYEQAGRLKEAADEYISIYRNHKDEAVQRDALFIAAALYEKSGADNAAIKYFKHWAHAYEEPFDNRMEARYHLSYLYKKNKDMIRHLYWLRRIIDGDAKGGVNRTDRSRWLAAQANAEYGDYWAWEFNRIKLRTPLEKWIPAKNEKLKNALERYERAAKYGIQALASRAFYSIGELYAKFAHELMNSPHPKGLTAVEEEQYELVLEKQAIPFEELAIKIHKSNIELAWEGSYNEWIARSYSAMAKLSPIRFDKQELHVSYGDGIK